MPRNTKPPPPHQGNIGPQKRTLEKMEMAERSIVEIKGMKNKKLAKERLQEGMDHFFGLMSQHQPDSEGNFRSEGSQGTYWKAAFLAKAFAAALAPYQSPTYRAVFFTPEVIGQAEISDLDARERMRQVIAGIAPELIDNEDEEDDDEPELVMSNGGAR